MAKELKTSPEGRTCRFPHCTQILSIYNHEAYCHIHRDQMAQKQKTKTAKNILPVTNIQPVL